ncbi:uncharacterized protein LOC130824910, partial [Amaranthus tricolor]|uniref:uncharacterized protein LOC130824910 n=1 Tax=Amaranthus tricolor TaxID=29722 RepID=UPI00258EA8BB
FLILFQVPDELVEHYLAKSGFQCPDVRLIRLVAVATQKFITEVATDSLQSNILVIIGTLFGIPGKSKDHKFARRDLKYLREEKDLRWVPELEVQELEDGSEEFPTSMLWMNDDEIEP